MSSLELSKITERPFAELAAANLHLLAEVEEHRKYIDVANTAAVRAGIVFIPHVIVGSAVTLAKWQTGFQDQQGRSTCYAFAAIAALEAAYNRQFGVMLGLSEQYAFHINKACELFGNYVTNGVAYENNSSLWGFQGSSDIIDKMARFAVPTRADCPYLSDAQMTALQATIPAAGTLSTQEELDAFEFSEQHIPTSARRNCRYQVKDYKALPPNPSVGDIQAVIAAGHEVVADIPNHCFLIIGYDIAAQSFIVKNSWGENAFIRYGFDQPILGGRYILDVHPPTAPPQKRAFCLGRWNVDNDGFRGSLLVRRWTDFRSGDAAPTKLGNYYRDGRRFDVNGTTTDDGQHLAFFISDNSDRVQPGAQVGQAFDSYVFSFDPVNAAGFSRWDNTDFGVTMRRAPLPPQPAMKPFDENEWIGTWLMEHDGWKGKLDIWSVRPLRATYRDSNGALRAVSGGLESGHPHLLNLSIAFASDNLQPFRLAASTWEKRVFAGTTRWANRNFGVQGERHDRFVVYGAIRAKWVALGAFAGLLGQPLDDETGTPDGVGRFNHFERGSIYWTAHTGAFEVHGAIRDKWASMGWEKSHLGYPVSDEKDWPNVPGGRRTDFEHGALIWDPRGGAREA